MVSRKRKRLEKLNQETLYDWASKSEAKRRWQSDIDPGMSALAPPLRTYYTNHSDHGETLISATIPHTLIKDLHSSKYVHVSLKGPRFFLSVLCDS